MFNGFGERVFYCAAVGFLSILVALTACSSTPIVPTRAPPTPDGNDRALAPTPTVTELRTVPASPTSGPMLGATKTITLTIWAPEEFAPEAANGGPLLQRQIEEFSRAHPDIVVNFVLKSHYGKGGLLDFMLKVQALVPARLPDMIVIDSREMDAAAKAELLQPLDHDLPAGAFADLLPPAQQLAQYEGQWLGLPVMLDVQHLVYNKQVVRTPPANWDQLLAGSGVFMFAAADDDPFLFQYLENRGRLAIIRPSTPLDIGVTTAVLSFYQRARAANLVPDTVFAIKTRAEAWQAFADGQAPLAQVSASDYIAGRGSVANASYAALPTQDGASTTLVNSWNYAIVTKDESRHAAAAEFLNWINEPSRLAQWATEAHAVPARRSAFAFAISPPEYGDFLLKLLDAGIVAPTFAQRASYQSAWHTALDTVLRGQATPSEAAQRAAQLFMP